MRTQRSAIRIASLILAAAIVAGCVRTSSTLLSGNMGVISGRGTAFDSSAGVLKANITAAANLTLSRGYRYFIVVDDKDTTRQGAIIIPGQTYTSGYAFGNSFSATSYTTPGSAIPLVKPGADLVIRMYRSGEISPALPNVWDAESVLAVDMPAGASVVAEGNARSLVTAPVASATGEMPSVLPKCSEQERMQDQSLGQLAKEKGYQFVARCN